MIYHIAKFKDFSLSKSRGSYFPGQYLLDGFIHCSTKKQVLSVANTWFLKSVDLVLLEIDEQILNVTVKYENLEGGLELYPHVYGEIPISAISRYSSFVANSSGFSFPTEWIKTKQ
jgi:uncharacterized protein (DUF952 family)